MKQKKNLHELVINVETTGTQNNRDKTNQEQLF